MMATFEVKRRRQIDFFLQISYSFCPLSQFHFPIIFSFYSEELFTQQIIFNIENFGIINLNPPVNLKNLVLLALDELNVSDTQPSSTGDLNNQADLAQKLLISKSQILEKFFNINVTESGDILSLPIILEGHAPIMAYLPNYILNLALCVDWENERPCFDTFSKITGKFYAKIAHTMDQKEWNWLVEHVLYAGFKQFLLPNKELIDSGAILKITSTQELYQVFERC